MTYRFRSACTTLRRDPGHLRVRDRAVLRILNRSEVATAAQLAVLAYGNRRLAQARLRQLWQMGYLERSTLPPTGPRGGAPYAYRLSSACLHRLGYRRNPWRGPGYLAHTLDAVEAVCALIRTNDPETEPLVQLWLPESIVADALPDGPVPDTIVVLNAADRLRGRLPRDRRVHPARRSDPRQTPSLPPGHWWAVGLARPVRGADRRAPKLASPDRPS